MDCDLLGPSVDEDDVDDDDLPFELEALHFLYKLR